MDENKSMQIFGYFKRSGHCPNKFLQIGKMDLGFKMIWHPAEKKGLFGVASLSKIGIEELSREYRRHLTQMMVKEES